jgi:hypothetical protein
MTANGTSNQLATTQTLPRASPASPLILPNEPESAPRDHRRDTILRNEPTAPGVKEWTTNNPRAFVIYL